MIPTLKGVMAVGIGVVLLLVGRNNWRHRDSEAIPILEDQLLKLTDEDPLPRTQFDRVFRRIQAALGWAFGLFFIFGGSIIIAGELGLL